MLVLDTAIRSQMAVWYATKWRRVASHFGVEWSVVVVGDAVGLHCDLCEMGTTSTNLLENPNREAKQSTDPRP